MNQILIQLFNNVGILAAAMIVIGFLQRGFLWRYLKVKISFGKYVMVRIRGINRTHYRTGYIIENFLIYKHDKNNPKRICINNPGLIYNSLGVRWVDVDEATNSLININGNLISGFDAVKFEELYERALYKPQINDNSRLILIIIIGVGLSIIGSIICGMMIFKLQQTIQALWPLISECGQNVSPIIASANP